jgi:hypothetical protein
MRKQGNPKRGKSGGTQRAEKAANMRGLKA